MSWLEFHLFGMVWWHLLLSIGFIIYWIALAVRTYYTHDDEFGERWSYISYKDNKKELIQPSFRKALKDTLYPKQKYFRVWDIVRTPFMLPGYALGLLFFLLLHAAWKFLPLWRKIFGIKLFQLEKDKEASK